jgi:hypothetical protein
MIFLYINNLTLCLKLNYTPYHLHKAAETTIIIKPRSIEV